LRQEQLRIEQEKRDAKKQRERERKERLKAEGKYMTDKQRQALARSKQTLEALRAQGSNLIYELSLRLLFQYCF
jgi:translation initiation factor 5B